MGCIREVVVLAILVTFGAARYVSHSEIPETPPELQDDDSFYPTELAEKIVANLTSEQLKLFNKDFLEDRDSESNPCAYEPYEKQLHRATAADGKEYYVVQSEKQLEKQCFLFKKCVNNSTSSACKPDVTDRLAACKQRGTLERALVIPIPIPDFETRITPSGKKLFYRNQPYESLDRAEINIFVEKSACVCVIS